MTRQTMELLEDDVEKLKRIVEEEDEVHFSNAEVENYVLCSTSLSRHFQNYKPLHDLFLGALTESIDHVIEPVLSQGEFEGFLEELLGFWSKYKEMVKLLLKIFPRLEKFRLCIGGIPLDHIPTKKFCSLVMEPFWSRILGTALLMIKKEREGDLGNGELLKRILELFNEIRERGSDKSYYRAFEEAMLKDTAVYYTEQPSNWILRYPFTEHMRKVDVCLEQEELLKGNYLTRVTTTKMLKLIRKSMLH